MTQWLENLKQLIGIEGGLKDIVKVNLFSNNTSKSAKLFSYENNSKTININVSSEVLQDPKQRGQLLEIVNAAALESPELPLLEAKASQEAEVIEQVESGDPLLQYFVGKLPREDVQILKAALVIKRVYESGHTVDGYKHELMQRYGRRGGDIANLCSAGYFETHIKPLYEELSKRPNFTPQMFVDRYNTIIDNRPFVVFINRDPIATLHDEIVEKIETNRAYGRKQLNIHAIGGENVRTLMALLEDKSISDHFTDEPSMSREGNIMNTTIFF